MEKIRSKKLARAKGLEEEQKKTAEVVAVNEKASQQQGHIYLLDLCMHHGRSQLIIYMVFVYFGNMMNDKQRIDVGDTGILMIT